MTVSVTLTRPNDRSMPPKDRRSSSSSIHVSVSFFGCVYQPPSSNGRTSARRSSTSRRTTS
jgi:hypothetical protein